MRPFRHLFVRRSLVVLVVATATLLGACVAPGSPGTSQRNSFLEATAGGWAVNLGATVEASNDHSPGTDDYSRCWDNIHKVWSLGTASRFGTLVHVCYTLTLPTHDATRGTVYMHEVGHVYWYRLDEEGHALGGDFADLELFAECFAAYHGGNSSCSQSHQNVIAALEEFYPPNNSTGWWTP